MDVEIRETIKKCHCFRCQKELYRGTIALCVDNNGSRWTLCLSCLAELAWEARKKSKKKQGDTIEPADRGKSNFYCSCDSRNKFDSERWTVALDVCKESGDENSLVLAERCPKCKMLYWSFSNRDDEVRWLRRLAG